MRRLAKMLFALCSAVSLLLCVLAIGLMVLPVNGTVVAQWDRRDGYGLDAVTYSETLFVYHGGANRTPIIVMLSVLAIQMAALPLLYLAGAAWRWWWRRRTPARGFHLIVGATRAA